METTLILLVLALACLVVAGSKNGTQILNVIDFGAIGDGKVDDSQAFLRAWQSACAGRAANPNIFFRSGTFLLNPMTLKGPCKSSTITIQVEGNLVAPKSTGEWHGASNWLTFHLINGLKIQGRGRIGGQGMVWWSISCYVNPHQGCLTPPTALSFDACNDLQITGVTLVDNPRNHISINNCLGVRIHNIFITAPATSPNTDGIDIGNSKHVSVWDSTIATGDDCIAILSGSSNVNISGVNCGPGHGISIGSLGSDHSSAAVEQVHVQHCTFSGTLNGARIKTWQGGSGYARGITFQDMHINNARHPIIIDQYYCTTGNGCANQSASVVVSDVRFIGFYGTSAEEVTVKLACSRTVGCRDIVLDNIKLRPSRPGMKLSSLCINAHGPKCPDCLPQVTCLI